MSSLLLGIDIGTYSSKGVLVAPDGTILKSHTVPHVMDIPRPGWAEQDADGIWWADTIMLCRALLDGAPYTGDDVAAMACSAIGACILPIDRTGKPLRPGILYGVDTRAASEIDRLNQTFGTEAIFEFSGMALTSQSIGPKIMWIRQNEPDIWAQTDYLTTASSYLVYRLTGEKVMDRHTASYYMPLIDIHSLEWSERFAGPITELSRLPRLDWSDAIAGTIHGQAAIETGLRPGTPVAVGAVDALSEGISVGAVHPGDLMIMYGSTTFFILVMAEPAPDPRVWTVGGAFKGQYDLAAGMSTTGSLTRWFRDELARELPEETAYTELFRGAAAIGPGAGGLLVLPYFSGERTPINDPDARGVISGLTLSHRREHLFRAVLESVAYGIRHNLETFNQIGAPVRRIIAVGGGAQGETWLQIVSDVTGVEQSVPRITIGASYGDAFLAGLASGILKRDDLDAWVRTERIIRPDAGRHALYAPLYEQYKQLYNDTRETMHFLSRNFR